METAYECMGGPADGSKFPKQYGLAIKTDGVMHYYQFCVMSNEKDKCARFFHYIGTSWKEGFEFKLRPHKRAFKFPNE